MALAGVAAIIAGIAAAKRRDNKLWYILSAAGAALAAAGAALILAGLLLLGGIAAQEPHEPPELPVSPSVDAGPAESGDWRTGQDYSEDYVITGELTVCLARRGGDTGYNVHNSANGDIIGELVRPDGAGGFFDVTVIAEDQNGDGAMDLGVPLPVGTTVWYIFDGALLGTPLENTGGCFVRREESKETTCFPYEYTGKNGLTEAQLALYDEMYPKISALEPFSYDAAVYGYETLNDVLTVWGAISEDHPEINNYFQVYEAVDEEGITAALESQYACRWDAARSQDVDEVRAGIESFNAACNEILAGLNDGMTAYEKYLYLAKEVSERADYDFDGVSYVASAPWGGVVGGPAICEGFAEAYQYLCQQADLWCVIVSGEAGGEAHGWNLIKLSDGTYHVDIMWAD